MNSHTQDEARTKWCPASRIAVDNGRVAATSNREGTNYFSPESLCVASACMWWQWDPHSSPTAQTQAEKVAALREGPKPPTRGFCGAAR